MNAATEIKGNTRRLYINDEDMAALDEIARQTKLGKTELLGQFVHAGIAAVMKAGNRIVFPLEFKPDDRLKHAGR